MLGGLDESVYDTARSICATRAIVGGSHALDDRATFATARGIRRLLEDEARRRGADKPTAPAITAALARLVKSGLLLRVHLERPYKTRRPRPVPFAGYIVVGDKP